MSSAAIKITPGTQPLSVQMSFRKRPFLLSEEEARRINPRLGLEALPIEYESPLLPAKITLPKSAVQPESFPSILSFGGQQMVDLTGQVFGRLTVIAYDHHRKNKGTYWLCRCSCNGNERVYRGHRLRKGHTRSCGCYRREVSHERGLAGAAERARQEVAKGQQPRLTAPVAIYELTDPRGLPWIYVGASEHPIARYSAHVSSKTSTNPRMACWLNELRELGLQPNFRVRGWVERNVAADLELQGIADARVQVGRYCLNTKQSPGYGRIYEIKPKSPKPTYGPCRTPACNQSATHKTGWCDDCYQIRIAFRDEAKRKTGSPSKAPRGTGTGLCHECRDPIPLNASRCEACKKLRRKLEPRLCWVCGIEFYPKSPLDMICSKTCRAIKNGVNPKPCIVCGVDFRPKSQHHVICSDVCREAKKNPLGLTLTERRVAAGRKGGKIRQAMLTQAQRRDLSRLARGKQNWTHEQRVKNGHKSWRTRQEKHATS